MNRPSWLLWVSVLLVIGVVAARGLPAPTGVAALGVGMADDPKAVAQAFFQAVLTATHGGAGTDAIDKLMATANWKDTHPVFATALQKTPWVFDSYVVGTDPAKGYAGVDPASAKIDIVSVETKTSDKLTGTPLEIAQVMVRSTGAPKPRPLYLRKTGDGWKVALATALCVGLQSADGNPGEDIAATSEPVNALRIYLEGCYLYILGFRDDGEALILSIQWPPVYESSVRMTKERCGASPWIFASYAQGTSVDQAYRNFDPFDFTLKITRTEPRDDGSVKTFVASTGADSPRPFVCKRTKRDQCRLNEYSSIYVDVRPPKKDVW